MAPSVADAAASVVPVIESKLPSKVIGKEPLKLSGALNSFDSFDVTPVIGKEFPDVSLKDLLRAPNSDELIRDLAITSQFLFLLTLKAINFETDTFLSL